MIIILKQIEKLNKLLGKILIKKKKKKKESTCHCHLLQ